MIEFEFEELAVGRVTILEASSFKIDDNCITTIIGDNGSGKTLLLKRMFKELKDAGEAVSFVEQSNEFIIKDISVSENISLNVDGDSVLMFMKRFGLEHLLNHLPTELSGGEKRMLCILRALYNLPVGGVLMIDEPTNDLDFDSVDKLLVFISGIAESHTVILASHDDRVKRITDSFIKIENCRVADDVIEHEIIIEKQHHAVHGYDTKVLRKSLVGNGVSIILSVLIVFLAVILLNESVSQFKDYDIALCDNQIDLFTADSSVASEIIMEGAIPISALEIMDASKSYAKRMRIIKESMEVCNDDSLFFDELEETSNEYDIYPLEIYNQEDREYISLLEEYGNKYGIQEGCDIDTMPYFYNIEYEEEFSVGKQSFTLEKLKSVIDNIAAAGNTDRLIITYAVIIVKTGTVSELITSESLDDYLNSNLFFISNVTSNMNEHINNANISRTCILFLMLICILMWVADALIIYLIMKKNMVPIVVFLDTGADFDYIYKCICGRYLSKVLYFAGIFACTVLTLLVLYWHGVGISVITCADIIIIGLFYFICYITRKRIFAKTLNAYNDWRFR